MRDDRARFRCLFPLPFRPKYHEYWCILLVWRYTGMCVKGFIYRKLLRTQYTIFVYSVATHLKLTRWKLTSIVTDLQMRPEGKPIQVRWRLQVVRMMQRLGLKISFCFWYSFCFDYYRQLLQADIPFYMISDLTTCTRSIRVLGCCKKPLTRIICQGGAHVDRETPNTSVRNSGVDHVGPELITHWCCSCGTYTTAAIYLWKQV